MLKQKKERREKHAARNNTKRKNSETKKARNSKNADCGFTGRFAERFSGERPDPLGFELTFLSEFSELFLRVLDRDAKRRACISQAPAKVPFEVFQEFYVCKLNSG